MNNGYLKTISNAPIRQDPGYAMTSGRVSGHSKMVSFGHNPTAAAGADIWEAGGAYPFQATATVLEILSASANDTAAGTGARTFTLSGLDANFNPISEVLTMNGVTPVASLLSYIRVNSLLIASAGSGNTNAGDVTLRVVSAGATQGIARAGYGHARTGIYTVPAGFTLIVTNFSFQCSGTGTGTNITYGFTRVGPTGLLRTTAEFIAGPLLPFVLVLPLATTIVEKTALTMRCTSVTGASNGAYSLFEGYLIDNTQLV